MKQVMKHLIVVFSLMAAFTLRAQYSDLYYHRIGDTIVQRPDNAYLEWWELDNGHDLNSLFTVFSSFDSGVVALRYMTTDTLKIIGLAGAPFTKRVSDATHPDPPTPEYFVLYGSDSTGQPVVLRKTEWKISDPHRYLSIVTSGSGAGASGGYINRDTCCSYNPWGKIYDLYEYYFDSAVYVTDSFYVGGTNHKVLDMNAPDFPEQLSNSVGIEYYQFGTPYLLNGIECGQTPQCIINSTPICSLTGFTHIVKTAQGPWRWIASTPSNPSWLYGIDIIYPIIQVDTTVPPSDICLTPTSVTATPSPDSSVLVTWDHMPNYQFVRLQYGARSIPVSRWQTVDVSSSSPYRIESLVPGVQYGVRLRASCDGKSLTAWSDTVWFRPEAAPPDPPEGIGTPSELARRTHLAPNPATGEVKVSSFFDLRSADIYNAAGVRVATQTLTGHLATLSLDGLRPGLYIVAIETFAGITHKRLVVQ